MLLIAAHQEPDHDLVRTAVRIDRRDRGVADGFREKRLNVWLERNGLADHCRHGGDGTPRTSSGPRTRLGDLGRAAGSGPPPRRLRLLGGRGRGAARRRGRRWRGRLARLFDRFEMVRGKQGRHLSGLKRLREQETLAHPGRARAAPPAEPCPRCLRRPCPGGASRPARGSSGRPRSASARRHAGDERAVDLELVDREAAQVVTATSSPCRSRRSPAERRAP